MSVGSLGDNGNPIRLTRYKKVMVPNIPSHHTVSLFLIWRITEVLLRNKKVLVEEESWNHRLPTDSDSTAIGRYKKVTVSNIPSRHTVSLFPIWRITKVLLRNKEVLVEEEPWSHRLPTDSDSTVIVWLNILDPGIPKTLLDNSI